MSGISLKVHGIALSYILKSILLFLSQDLLSKYGVQNFIVHLSKTAAKGLYKK